MHIKLTLFFFLMFTNILLFAQSMSYTTFKGKAYKYPSQMKYIQFEEDYHDRYPLLSEFSWDSIHVDQRDTDKGFPDVDYQGAFGIMFSSVLTIETTSMYRFAITSDDGSIVWIDGKKVLDNDYSNGMHMKEDTIALRPGDYRVKVWYYQAYPTMFGVIYESNPVVGEVKFDIDTITIDHDFLFEIGRKDLKEGSSLYLDRIGQVVLSYPQVKISIVGHTDDLGRPEKNLKLSWLRAESVKKYLMANFEHTGAIYSTKGVGETVPIANNDLAEGRAKNRRVEILIEGY